VTATGSAGGPPTRSLPAVHESWLPREHDLYRPRHGQQGLALVCAAVFFFVPLLAYVVGVRSSPIENHQPRAFPSPADGWGFLTGLPAWASDNLPFRDLAIQAQDALSRSVFGEPPRYGDAPDLGPIPSNPTPTTGAEEQQPNDGFPTVVEGRDDWLYFGFDLRGKCRPSQSLDTVVGNVQRLRQAVERSGRRFVLVVAPDKTTMVPENMPDTYAGKSCSAGPRQEFWQRANAELQVVDLREPLHRESTIRGGPVYFPQDTHWNFAGGMTMTRELVERLRSGTSGTWRSTDGPQWSAPADLPTMIGKSGTNRAMKYGLAPDGGVDRANFFDGDFLSKTLTLRSLPVPGMINTPVTMFADSFTQFATPYLGAAFSQISIIHLANLEKDPNGTANSVTYGQTVVVQVVERNLAAGTSIVSDPAAVDALSNAVTARPFR
jgi:alginate O-acetyltransferase complex protein AlgJ